MHGHSLILTSPHFVHIPRGPIFVGLHSAALRRHTVTAAAAVAAPADWPLTPVAYRNPRQRPHSQHLIGHRRTLLAEAAAQRLSVPAVQGARLLGAMAGNRHCNQTLSPSAQASQPHLLYGPSLPRATPCVVDVASGFADPLCCRGLLELQVQGLLCSAFGVIFQPLPRCTVLPSQGRRGTATCPPTLLLAYATSSPLVQHIRLGAFSCRLTPLTWKRLATGQPGPQLAAKGSADHPCGDRLVRRQPNQETVQSCRARLDGYQSAQKVLSHPTPVTSCQRHTGDLKSRDRLRKSATTPTVDGYVGFRCHYIAFPVSYRTTAAVRPRLADSSEAQSER